MTEPTYMLDGIQTAYTESAYEGFDGSRLGDKYTCPCGWATSTYHRDLMDTHMTNAALRFHYQNCRLARLPTIDPEDT